jgi:hypothetical protein
VSDPKKPWGYAVCARTGGFGILSGFMLFLLWWDEGTHVGLGRFVIGLIVAAAIAFIIESLRERIEHGHGEEDDPLSRLPVNISIALIFELYVVAFHGAGQNVSWDSLSDAMNGVLGHYLAEASSPQLNLTAFVVVWVALGAGLAWLLSFTIKMPGEFPERGTFGAAVGGLAGGIAAPVIVVGSVLFARSIGMACWMINDYYGWKANLTRLSKRVVWGIVLIPLNFVTDQIERWHASGIITLVIGVFIFSGLLLFNKKYRFLLYWFGGGALAILLVPVLDELRPVGTLFLLTGLVWVVPGVWIGFFVPWLEPPSAAPKSWGFVCLLGAVSLFAVTFLRLQFWELSWIPAVVLAGAGVLLLRVEKAETYWPLLALGMAAVLFGSMQLMQATFGGAFREFHKALGIPLSVEKPPATFAFVNHDDDDPKITREVELFLHLRAVDEAKADAQAKAKAKENAARSRDLTDKLIEASREKAQRESPLVLPEPRFKSRILDGPPLIQDVPPERGLGWDLDSKSSSRIRASYGPQEEVKVRESIERMHLDDPKESIARKEEIRAAIDRRKKRLASAQKHQKEMEAVRDDRNARLAQLPAEQRVLDGPYLENEINVIAGEVGKWKARAADPTWGLRQKMEVSEEPTPKGEHGPPPVKKGKEIEHDIRRVEEKLFYIGETLRLGSVSLESGEWEATKPPLDLGRYIQRSQKPETEPNQSHLTFERYRTALGAARSALEKIDNDLRNQVWQLLELALASSFGFWATAGLLAAWASANRPSH